MWLHCTGADRHWDSAAPCNAVPSLTVLTGYSRAGVSPALCSAYAAVSVSFYSGQRQQCSILSVIGMLLCSAAALMLLPKAQPDARLYSTSPSAVDIRVGRLDMTVHPDCLRALLLLGRSTARAALGIISLSLTMCAVLHSASFTALRCNRASSTSIQSLTLLICGCTGLRSRRMSSSRKIQS